MLANASLTRDAPDDRERTAEAARQIHQAMYRFALGQISEAERTRVLQILRPCCPEIFVTPASRDVPSPALSDPYAEPHRVRRYTGRDEVSGALAITRTNGEEDSRLG
jgi:hypothetical protein